MEETFCSKPRTVEEVYYDFKKRRVGLIKALTSDAKKFYKQCDPEKENLCLYGLPSKTWEVNLPVEEVPPDLPEPTLGINFARDAMKKQDWLSMVAFHSDSWLIAVAFHFAARFGFGNNDRKRLFLMINELPTIYEVVAQKSEHHTTGWEVAPGPDEESSEESEEEYDWDELLCGVCGSGELRDKCWICCEVCDQWYHSMCVKISNAKSVHLRQFKCPDCTSKKGVSA